MKNRGTCHTKTRQVVYNNLAGGPKPQTGDAVGHLAATDLTTACCVVGSRDWRYSGGRSEGCTCKETWDL